MNTSPTTTRAAITFAKHYGEMVLVRAELRHDRAVVGGLVEDPGALLAIQHIAMLPSMLVVMLLRLDEYTAHGGHAHAAA